MSRFLVGCSALVQFLFLPLFVFAQGPHVREIPIPKEASETSYMKSRGDIRMTFPGDMKKAGEQYQQLLSQQQWSKSGKDNLQRNFWVQTFKKQNLELEVRADNRDAGCEIRVTPKGFLWDEDFAPRPEDIPIPDNAKQLKYDAFFSRIEFEHPDSHKALAEFYASKLDSKTWVKSGSDSIFSDSAVVRRTSGMASITIFIDREDDKCEVKIDTKGMSWDKVKLAKLNEKKKAEAASSATMSNSTGKSTGSNLPARPDKPIRGIEKLERLPSAASVTIDGKTTSLPEIVAYDLIAYGTWRTHIVATAQPIKQEILLKLLKENVPEEKWGDRWKLPSPNVVLILDADDSLRSVQLYADKVPGSSTEVFGEAIVENGRARGKAQLKPQKFFEHSYAAEISFDTSLLNGSTAPTKRLDDAPKLATAGKIIMAGKSYSLPHVVSYEVRSGDQSKIHVLMTEKPMDVVQMRASLKQSGEVPLSMIGFQSQVGLVFDMNDNLSSMFLYCDGASIHWSGTDKVETSVQSEGDRIRGTAKSVGKNDFFGKAFEFDVSFDTTIVK
jgi:hypothetical protein